MLTNGDPSGVQWATRGRNEGEFGVRLPDYTELEPIRWPSPSKGESEAA